MGVCHRLEGGKCLRRNDEKGLRWIKVLNSFGEVCAIDVGDKTKRQGALAVMLERLVGHYRPKVRAADAYVDDVVNALTRVAQPASASDAIGEVRHFVEYSMHFGYDVCSVNDNGCSLGGTQSYVKNGAILRNIDLVSAEHGFDPALKAGFL